MCPNPNKAINPEFVSVFPLTGASGECKAFSSEEGRPFPKVKSKSSKKRLKPVNLSLFEFFLFTVGKNNRFHRTEVGPRYELVL